MAKEIKKFIDLDAVLKKKNPKLYRFLPGFALRYLKKIVHQDDLNRDIDVLLDYPGLPFFNKFTSMIDWKIEIEGEENIPKEGKYIFASNHPLGGPDGIIFIAAMSRYYPHVKFMVNDLLMYLPGVDDVFLPVNKLGGNTKDYQQKIDSAYSNPENQVLVFPAGMVSRKIDGKIKDLDWKKTFISQAKKYERDVIPVYIKGNNSKFFYNFAALRKKLGIKVNLEMLFLVDELYKNRGKTFVLRFGKPIPYTTFDNTKKPDQWAQYVKELSYTMEG